MQNFKKLNAWAKAHLLTLLVYEVTKSFPKEELYGITSQLRRACSSIPTNIAEGCGRKSRIELSRFLQISLGSASEFEYLILLSRDLHYLAPNTYVNLQEKISEIKKMLSAFISTLKHITDY